MKTRHALRLFLVALVVWSSPGLTGAGHAQAPTVQIPNPGVPEILTMEAKFVRAAYNNEGYAILGYQASNRSIGDEWMLLEVGFALRDGVPDYTLLRSHISLDIPDGQTLPTPSIQEYRQGNPMAIQQRAKVQRDSINYFPPNASRACALVFFPDLNDRALPREDAFMDDQRACVGRLYFKIPGGIKYGQYWLNVKFAKSLIRVPFRILTEEEEKLLSKNYKAIDKQVEEAFKPRKK
jgi:hypothetical protein